MKKLLLFLGAAALTTAANAQIPVEKNVSLFGKLTANWCPPCGSWGWDLNDEMLTNNKATTVGLSMYADVSQSQNNGKFQNQAAYDLKTLITLTGWPSFSVNMVDVSQKNSSGGSVNTAGIKSDAAAAITAFAAEPVVASTGILYRIHNDTVTVNTKTKFWADATGTYKIAVYLIEDGALNTQASKSGTVEHHNVLRTSMTTSTWGVAIPAASVKKDGEFEQEFTFDLKGSITPAYADQPSTWDKTKLVPFAVIYKVESGKHVYVNGNRHYDYPAAIREISSVDNITMYPNPATSQTTVAFEAVAGSEVNINVIDNVGRTVYTSGAINAVSGRTFHTINTANFPSGLYNVMINTESGMTSQKLNILK